MKYTNELMLMIARFLHGELDAEEFSFEFPARLAGVYRDFKAENVALCAFLEDEMPELCAAYDPHDTGEPGMLGQEVFRQKALEVYQRALPLSMRTAS